MGWIYKGIHLPKEIFVPFLFTNTEEGELIIDEDQMREIFETKLSELQQKTNKYDIPDNRFVENQSTQTKKAREDK
jgi:hypothetical protein|tara:strand:+ start:495 stop:722 length:228 start_codon:yes stop_codon:yes gene_type:complete